MRPTKRLCRQCGKCCSYEVPVTLLDFDRMVAHLNVEPGQAFDQLLQSTPSTAGVFKMAKDAHQRCVMLDEANRCRIHAARPSACRLYFCQDDDGAPVLATTRDPADWELMWEQSVAMLVTQAYVQNNACRWSAEDFPRAMASIRSNVRTTPTQKLRLARDGRGHAVSMLYDCSECDSQGQCAKETLVTLDDLRRIAKHLGAAPSTVFEQFVDPRTGEQFKGLVLKRADTCVFRTGGECRLASAKPMHCRFTPCPKQAQAITNNPLYFGPGSLQQQHRHHIALALTQRYVQRCGTRYNRTVFKQLMRELDALVSDKAKLAEFAAAVGPYRYVAVAPTREKHA